MSETRRVNRDKWRQIIDDQQASGRTVAAFCRDRQVGQASFFAWRRRLSSRQASPPPPRFVEVTRPGFVLGRPMAAEAVADAAAIEVHLSGRRRLLVRQGFDHSLLIELIQTLESLP
jgi:transposase-like protein